MDVAQRLAEGIDDRVASALERLQRYDDQLDIDGIAEAVADGSAMILPLDGGFSVLNISHDALHIWVACAYDGHAPDIKSSVADIIALAKLLKLRKVTFGTRRRGWTIVAKRIGFTRNGDNYERLV